MVKIRPTKERICIDCGMLSMIRKDCNSVRCGPCGSKYNFVFCKAALSKKPSTAVTLTCCRCLKEFKRNAGARPAKNVYCSFSCRRSHKSIPRICKYCSIEFFISFSKVFGTSNSSGNFCSRPCYEKWLCRTDRVTGRGSQWNRISKEVKSKYPFCAFCARIKGVIQVHHIVPFRLTHCNDKNNLIPLCLKCHKTIESITNDVESIVDNPDDLFVVMSTILRYRQMASFFVLRKVFYESKQSI